MLSKERLDAISKAVEIISMYSPELVQCMKNMSVFPLITEPPFDNPVGGKALMKAVAPQVKGVK